MSQTQDVAVFIYMQPYTGEQRAVAVPIDKTIIPSHAAEEAAKSITGTQHILKRRFLLAEEMSMPVDLVLFQNMYEGVLGSENGVEGKIEEEE